MKKLQKYIYKGEDILTRGDFGETIQFGYQISGETLINGHWEEADPQTLYVWDSVHGYMPWGIIEYQLSTKNWEMMQ